MKHIRLAAAVLAAVAAVGAVAFAGGSASAKPEFINGHFDLKPFTGPDCSSPTGVCMNGTVDGRIKGAFSFIPTTLEATADSPTTNVYLTTGDASVETRGGTISCKHAGPIQLSGDGPFVSLCVITGGTGEWTGATGYLRITGTFTLAGGTGSYDGRLVLL